MEEVAGLFEHSQLHRAANFHVNEFGENKNQVKVLYHQEDSKECYFLSCYSDGGKYV